MELKNKFILDACCGGRMMWFNKKHPNTLYIDNRQASKGHISLKSNHEVNPDIVMDFRELKFPNKTFRLVVWDPPHRTDFTKTSLMAKQFGILNKETWPYDLGQGFKECWRVLQDYGILIFKWNEKQIKLKSILKLFPVQPLFGNIKGANGKRVTYWICFMKIPQANGGINFTQNPCEDSVFSERKNPLIIAKSQLKNPSTDCDSVSGCPKSDSVITNTILKKDFLTLDEPPSESLRVPIGRV